MARISEFVTVKHWLPIITICPVNKLPDLIYISVSFSDGKLHELYSIRKEIKRGMFLRYAFMEDIAKEVFARFPDADRMTLRLAFNRHEISLVRTRT